MSAPPPIDTNNYAIEYTQGPVFASNRVVGLGGAATAIAESVEGMYASPAAPAVRSFDSTKWFDWSLDGGLSFAGAYGSTDYENRGKLGVTTGERAYTQFLRVNFGFTLQFGSLAVGSTFDVISTNVSEPSASTRGLALDLITYHMPISYAVLDKQLIFGVGLRSVAVSMNTTTLKNGNTVDGPDVYDAQPIGSEFGVIVRPNESRWRASVTFRPEASGHGDAPGGVTTNGVTRVANLITPTHVIIPAELEAGVAVQLGERQLNPPFVDVQEAKLEVDRTVGHRIVDRVAEKNRALEKAPADQRDDLAAKWDARNDVALAADKEWAANEKARLSNLSEERREAPRQKLLLLASVVVVDATTGSVAISGFLDQSRQPVGQSITFAPHAGAEFEPLENRLKLQVGSYVEPSRFAGVGPREHGTAGLSLRLFEWTVFGLFPPHTSWTVNSSADVATRGYYDWGLSVGTWD